MGLVTRLGSGSKLNSQQMDGNLTYLEKIKTKTTSTRKVIASRTLSNDTEILQGGYVIDYTPNGTTIPIKYGENLEHTLESEFGYSYHINATLGIFNPTGQYSSNVFNSSLISNSLYITPPFEIGTGFNNLVYATAIQTDGKILVGGSFRTYNDVASSYIIRLNTDGTTDTSFLTGSGFNADVRTITLQTDGKILVGGSFRTYNGVASSFIIRLNTNGTTDTSFNIGGGFNNPVYATAIQTDGKILVGGSFQIYNGVTENKIIRLNADGSKDTSFLTGTGFNNLVNTIVIQSDGKILVGGDFQTYNTITSYGIARLNADGSYDSTFVTNGGFNYGGVLAIAIQSDGKILVGGHFGLYGSISQWLGHIARLNADGSYDSTFVTGSGFNGSVYAIAIQTDGKILVGGGFMNYNGVASSFIIRLNTNGTKDTSFNIGGTGFNNLVYATAIQTDGKILVGGAFSSYNDLIKLCFIRLNANGSSNTASNLDSKYISTSTDSNNKLGIVSDKIHITTNNTIMDYMILNYTLIKTHW